MEWAASLEALANGRAREQQAADNEQAAFGDYLPTTDLLALRYVAACHQRIFPGPHHDGLERA